MSKFKYGDMVNIKNASGLFMFVGPYLGPRGKNDNQEPASWVMDIDTEYMQEYGHENITWIADSELLPSVRPTLD